jgi:DNA polymerase-3 subunit gamma/tau
MTYIPLARKWRPKCFADLIGQDHIVTPLQNALNNQKLHHAYLFTGTRGVGKTTVARIFAKALNCLKGIVSEPCLRCENCQAIDSGQFFDLIEVDGASRTRVEDTRELLENIQYAPTTGRFKIFLIDEVHMLSTHSFNALLKTLEEPPEHVKFLLATTDPQKLPATILSRCLQFNLGAIAPVTIEKQLQHILTVELFKFENNALKLIAEKARGSMRDALTLTEQLMAAFPDGLYQSQLLDYLGYSLEQSAHLLIQTLVRKDVKMLIEQCAHLSKQHTQFSNLIHKMMLIMNECAIYKVLPDYPISQPSIASYCQYWTSKEIHQLYLMLEKASQELDWAPNHGTGFQMLCLRLYYILHLNNSEQGHPVEQLAPTLYEDVAIKEELTPILDLDETPVLIPEPEPIIEEIVTPETIPSDLHSSKDELSPQQWSELVEHLTIDGLGKSALKNTYFISKNEETIILEIDANYRTLFTNSIKERIEKSLSLHFSHPIQLKLENSKQAHTQTPAIIQAQHKTQQQELLHQKVHQDPFVQSIIEECNGEIIENSMTNLTNIL